MLLLQGQQVIATSDINVLIIKDKHCPSTIPRGTILTASKILIADGVGMNDIPIVIMEEYPAVAFTLEIIEKKTVLVHRPTEEDILNWTFETNPRL